MCLSAGKKQRLVIMFCMTFGFMLTELIVGYCGDSMALVADSFHMLSDVIALVVAFVSILLSPRSWKQSTFGWARAEVLGALINAVFLIALCVTIVVEAFKRFIHPELISEPQWILCVGICGLIINLIGLFIFRGHAHSHGGNSDSHSQSHSCEQPAVPPSTEANKLPENGPSEVHVIARMSPDLLPSNTEPVASTPGTERDHGFINVEAQASDVAVAAQKNQCQSKELNSSQMNMRGVFLHVLADAMGSIAVIISASVVWATEEARHHEGNEFWRGCIAYIDPVLSIIIVLLILTSTWPLLYQASMILLQAIPSHIKLDELRRQLIEEVDGVLSVHEFHIWQLAGNKFVASVHLRCADQAEYVPITLQAKQFFHRHGINSTTIQVEFNTQSANPQNLLKTSIEQHSTACLVQCSSDSRN